MEQAKTIEQVAAADKPIDAAAILTDDELLRGGLVKVDAYVRTKTSAAAARKAKQREKQEAEGVKQVNIQGKQEVVEPLKEIARHCAQGKTIEDAIKIAVPTVTSHGLVTPEHQIGEKILKLKGWKAWVAKFLIG